jgi:hypothetical protein
MKITNLKLTEQKVKRDAKLRKEFKVSFVVDGIKLKGEMTFTRDDGSIKRNIGKWYPYAEIGKYISPINGYGSGDCPKCKTDLSEALMKAIQLFVAKKHMKLACLWDDYSGWELFTHHIPNTGEYETAATDRRSEEVVAIYLEAPALCPIHGKVVTEDMDVAD